MLLVACSSSDPAEPRIDAAEVPACIAYDGPPSDGFFPVDGSGAGELQPTCAPRCGAGSAPTGFPFAEALPSGTCTGFDSCDLGATPRCGCSEDRGPVNHYRCTCTSGAWRCRIVVQGGSICRASCADAGEDATIPPDTSIDTGPDVAVDAGPCGAGKHVAYFVAGCSAEPSCLPDGPEDACSWTFCGCDGKTLAGPCGYSRKPFVGVGACGEPLKTCAADRLPIAGTACTMANGTYCRLKSCGFGCEDECACRDGTWVCTPSCRDAYGCGTAPSCTDTCPSDAGGG